MTSAWEDASSNAGKRFLLPTGEYELPMLVSGVIATFKLAFDPYDAVGESRFPVSSWDSGDPVDTLASC